MVQKYTDDEFVQAWHQANGSPENVARLLNVSARNVYSRRKRLAERGVLLTSNPATPSAEGASKNFTWTVAHEPWERRRLIPVPDGTVIIWSDAHFYPECQGPAYYALLTLIRELKPSVVINAGDALDGTQISKWEPTRGWHKPPPLAMQLDTMVKCMDEIREASGKARLAWCLGNHDARLSRYLSVRAPEVEDLPGTSLEDYCPDWPLSWTVQLNEDTIVRHRPISGGLHSTYQSPLRAGVHFCHGHLHQINIRRVPRYGISGSCFNYGIDCGSISCPTSDAFDYAEDGIPHVSGFAILHFRHGKLVSPEVCEVIDGTAYFRGEPV